MLHQQQKMPPRAAAGCRRQHKKAALPPGMPLGRAKSCQWQVFVRRRPPKQGELRTDVSKATMWGETGRRKSTRSGKEFNWVCAKLSFGCAESRFVEPRSSLRGCTDLFFSLVRKERGVPQRFANLWTPGTIQISARFKILAKMTGHHHVTGRTGDCKVSGYRR